jgi:hypothetical protein
MPPWVIGPGARFLGVKVISSGNSELVARIVFHISSSDSVAWMPTLVSASERAAETETRASYGEYLTMIRAPEIPGGSLATITGNDNPAQVPINPSMADFFRGIHEQEQTSVTVQPGDISKGFQLVGGQARVQEDMRMTGTSGLEGEVQPALRKELVASGGIRDALKRSHMREMEEEKCTSLQTIIYISGVLHRTQNRRNQRGRRT